MIHPRDIIANIIGCLLVLVAFAWSGFDASQHAGRVASVTAIGALVLGATGGWLISKTKTLAILNFLFEQAKRLGSIKFPSVGSGPDA